MLGKRLRNGPEYAESPEAFSEQSETIPKKEKNAKDICFAIFFGSKKKLWEYPGCVCHEPGAPLEESKIPQRRD